MHYVYILSCADGSHYVGETANMTARFHNHKNKKTISTKYRLPVKIKLVITFPERKKAKKFERYLKSHSGRAFLRKRLI